EDAGPGLDAGPEDADHLDEIERRPNCALGVILAGSRRAPDRHDRVADELLDDPAVATDDLRCQLEVAGEGVADVLRVALLGERGKPDEVGEEDADETPFGARASRRGALGERGRRG